MLSFSHNSLDFLLPTRFSIFYYILVSITLYLLYRISTSPSTNPAATASYFLSFSAYFPSEKKHDGAGTGASAGDDGNAGRGARRNL